MKKPVGAIEQMRTKSYMQEEDVNDILSYLDSIPEGAHICKWPEGLDRERLDNLAASASSHRADALRALAAIAPEEKKKRKVWLWEKDHPHYTERSWTSNDIDRSGGGWRKVGECEVSE